MSSSWFKKLAKMSSAELLVLPCLSVFLMLTRIPSWFEPWWYGDENIYMAVGQGIARGQWLYAEAWDNKPPLIYLVYAISYVFFGDGLWSLRFLNTLLSILEILSFFIIGRKLFAFDSKTMLWATGLLTFFLASGLEGTIFNGENIFTPLIWFGFLIIFSQIRHYLDAGKWSILWLIFGSLPWSLATFTKVQAILEVGFLTLLFVIIVLQKLVENGRRWKEIWQVGFLWKFFGLIFIILILPYLAIFTIYSLKNELDILLYSLFGFGQDYIDSGKNPVLFGVSLDFISGVKLRAILLVGTLIFSGYWFIKQRLSLNWFLLLNWLGIGIFSTLLSERNYAHYLLQILPILLLVAVAVIQFIRQTEISANYRISSGVLSVLILQTFLTTFTGGNFIWNYFTPQHYFLGFGGAMFGQNDFRQWQIDYNQDVISSQPVLSQKIQSYTSKNDTIFIVANRPDLYFLSGRIGGDRFVVDYNFRQEQTKQVLATLIKNDTKLILIDQQSDKSEMFMKNMETSFELKETFENRYSFWLKK